MRGGGGRGGGGGREGGREGGRGSLVFFTELHLNCVLVADRLAPMFLSGSSLMMVT